MNIVEIMGLFIPFSVFSFERMNGIIGNLFLIFNYSKIVTYNFGSLPKKSCDL